MIQVTYHVFTESVLYQKNSHRQGEQSMILILSLPVIPDKIQ